MRTRYTILRETVANLAAAAEAQVAYLDNSFSRLTGGGSAEAYGNDELALEFEDSFVVVDHMLECVSTATHDGFALPLGQLPYAGPWSQMRQITKGSGSPV